MESVEDYAFQGGTFSVNYDVIMGTWVNLGKVAAGYPDITLALCPKKYGFHSPQAHGLM